MGCKKDVQAKFIGETVHIEANYDFGPLLKITIHSEIRPKSGGDFTSKEIQEAPIRVAIQHLQQLLQSKDSPAL